MVGDVPTPLTAAGSAMSRTALGVGVAGGGGTAVFWTRLLGVVGAVDGGSPFSAGDGALLLRDLAAGAGGGGIDDVSPATGFASAWALRRADLRLAILGLD